MKLKEIFNIEYPKTLIFSEQTLDKEGINFVSSSAKNNGVVGKVSFNPKLKKYPAGIITVPLKGSVLNAFVQPEACYVAHQIAILSPKKEMSNAEKIFYCLIIRANRFRYNFGRQADKTLANLELPENVPPWVSSYNFSKSIDRNPVISKEINLTAIKWKYFRYDSIFDIKKGYYNKKPPISEHGEVPFIGATEENNGITSNHNIEVIENYNREGKYEKDLTRSRIFKGNCITVSNNGSVGYAFYQPVEFTCSHDINPLYLKEREMNVFIALFLCTIIGLERYRWNYGRKWRPMRMPSSVIKLPVDKKDNPDWDFMERYMKSLIYSKVLSQ